MSGWSTSFSITQKIQEIDLASVRSTFESNILQMIAISKFAVPHMKRGSSIINTTSVVAYGGAPNLGASSLYLRRRYLMQFNSGLLCHEGRCHELYSLTGNAVSSLRHSCQRRRTWTCHHLITACLSLSGGNGRFRCWDAVARSRRPAC
jgi:NAD(P)-dependent dehydrogenase (short-subunit alcohol dehydrogenase family)